MTFRLPSLALQHPATWPCSDTRPPSCLPDPPSSHPDPEAQVDAISLLLYQYPTSCFPLTLLWSFRKVLVVMLITQSIPVSSAPPYDIRYVICWPSGTSPEFCQCLENLAQRDTRALRSSHLSSCLFPSA